MIALLKYGSGFPFYRLKQLQDSLGVPLPASTQWEIIERVADRIHPVFRELIRLAAQGEVIHSDDTNMKILELMKEYKDRIYDGEERGKPSRRGIFTTGILSIVKGRRIALFFTGRNHGGENNELVCLNCGGLHMEITPRLQFMQACRKDTNSLWPRNFSPFVRDGVWRLHLSFFLAKTTENTERWFYGSYGLYGYYCSKSQCCGFLYFRCLLFDI